MEMAESRGGAKVPSGIASGAVLAMDCPIGRGAEKSPRRSAKGTLFVLLLAVSALLPAAAQVKPVRHVLVFNDFGSVSSPGMAEMDREIFDTLQNSSYRVEFYNENLEVTLFPEEASQRQVREWYIRKYSDRRPDVIITVGPASLRFMQEMHEGPFKDTPVLFCGIMEIPAGLEPNSRFTGAWSGVRPEKTIESALRLQPGTRHVVVVGGVGSLDRQEEAIVRGNLRGYESKFDFTYLTDLSMPNLLEQLKLLPSDTIVLHTAMTQDTAGNRFIDATQAVPMVAGAARVPVFVLDDVDLNNGAVGGDLLSWAATARDAAKGALRILNGEKPQDIPIIRSDNVFMFDWQALRRWGLKEADLPPGSNLLNRKPTFWETFKWYIIGGFSLILAEAVLIFGLLVQRARRKTAEEGLQKSEARFSKVFRLSPMAKTLTRLRDEHCVDLNEAFEHLSGWRRDEVLGRTPAEIGIWTDPDERRRFVEELERERHVRDHEAQFHTKSGEIRMVSRSSDLVEIDGELCALTVIADITERKRADEQLQCLSGELLRSQDEERRRIAMDLHDSTGQDLVALATMLVQLRRSIPSSERKLRRLLSECKALADKCIRDVRTLSYVLHPPVLDASGLCDAVRDYVDGFAKRSGIHVELELPGRLGRMPRDVELALFRVVQEALTNIQRHSGSQQAKVRIHSNANPALEISDRGHGASAHSHGERGVPRFGMGVGISSMQERVRLIGGRLDIESTNQGTTVRVTMPLGGEHEEASNSDS
jgi:PAS domain S-box-containing protein